EVAIKLDLMPHLLFVICKPDGMLFDALGGLLFQVRVHDHGVLEVFPRVLQCSYSGHQVPNRIRHKPDVPLWLAYSQSKSKRVPRRRPLGPPYFTSRMSFSLALASVSILVMFPSVSF